MMHQTTSRKVRLAARLLRDRWISYYRAVPHQVVGTLTPTKRPSDIWAGEQHLICGYGERIACLLNPDGEPSLRVLNKLVVQRRAQLLATGGPLVTKRGTRRRWFRPKRNEATGQCSRCGKSGVAGHTCLSQNSKKQVCGGLFLRSEMPRPNAAESEVPGHITMTLCEIEIACRYKQHGVLHRAWWGDDSALAREQVVLLYLSGALMKARWAIQSKDSQPRREPIGEWHDIRVALRNQHKHTLRDVWEAFRWAVMRINLWAGSGGRR